jgi:hypothetical protein
VELESVQPSAGTGLRFHVHFGGQRTILEHNISALNGTWIHLAGVWDRNGIGGSSDVMRLYLDGQVVAASQLANWGTVVGQTADIGGANDYNIAGQFALDNLKIYDVALTDFSHRFQEAPIVPEPGTATLLTLGGLLLLRFRAADGRTTLPETDDI